MGKISKTFTLFLVLLFLYSLVLLPSSTVNAQSKTIVIPDDYFDIQHAVDAANDGDRIFVRKGTHNLTTGGYGENVLITKSLSLIGEDCRETFLIGVGKKYVYTAITVSADNVTISGFTMKGGISILLNVGGSGCRILGNTFFGELLIFGENNIVSENNIIGDRLYVSGSNHLISRNNVSESPGAGVELQCQNVTVRDNSIFNNGLESENDFIRGGIVLDNGPIFIYQNNITNNQGYGIGLNPGSNATIFNNNILHNDLGIRLVMLNKTEIRVTGNNVYYNNFVDNDKNVAGQIIRIGDFYVSGFDGTDFVLWDNSVIGNYWSDYNGSGIYIIDQNNVDRYPLTQQVDVNSIAPTPMPFSISNFSSVAIIAILIIVVLVFVFVFGVVYVWKKKTDSKPAIRK
jgi:hypothetical protein